MILQELLRNIVLYRGVVKPVLQAWKESLFLRYIRLTPQLVIKNHIQEAVSLEAVSHAFLTGTLTIPFYIVAVVESIILNQAKQRTISATVGNDKCTVLMGGGVAEKAVTSSITDYFCYSLGMDKFSPVRTIQRDLTTGFIIENLYLYLSETHEERELLGGFSLSHEGNPLLYLTERR